MRLLLAIHRAATLFVVVFALYLSVTGTLTLLVDLRSALTHAPENDPNVVAMWQDLYGPADFKVISVADCTAPALPAASDFGQMLARVVHSALEAAPNTTIRYAELRMLNGRPVGQLGTPDKILRFDALTGVQMVSPAAHPSSPEAKPLRYWLKAFHRMTYGTTRRSVDIPGVFAVLFAALCLLVLLVTGIFIFLPMWKVRASKGRSNPFWKSGGWWRTLHRVVSTITAVFLACVILSGMFLAVDNVYHTFHETIMTSRGPISPSDVDASSPLRDAELPGMLRTTLAVAPAEPIKVIRLRYFAGMPQGVLVVGTDDFTHQVVFNTSTGKPVSTTEPGYPPAIFPFGWKSHQIAKSIHRGAFFGLTGNMMVFFTGLSMFYLSLSGIVLYYNKWKQRRRTGKSNLIWV